MQTDTLAVPPSRGRKWAGRIIGGLPALFLLVDGVMKLSPPPMVVEMSAQLGYSKEMIFWLGLVLTASTILYLIPATAAIGAALITGYLGGAVNTHVAHGDDWFPIFFPVLIGILIWTGLVLRDPRLSVLLLWRRGCCSPKTAGL